MKRPWLLLVLLVLLAAAVPASAAEMYTWTDANGVKHFSDSPPPASTKAEKLKLKGGVTTSTLTDEAQDAASDGPALAKAAGYSPEDIKRHCETAKRNLAALTARPPTLGEAADGDAAQSHRAQLDKANQQIKLFCGD